LNLQGFSRISFKDKKNTVGTYSKMQDGSIYELETNLTLQAREVEQFMVEGFGFSL
jgi:hypothetical protein